MAYGLQIELWDSTTAGEQAAVNRLEREFQTISAMIRMYCRDKHRTSEPVCGECAELMNYTALRILRCPHEERKPSCAKCEIHCFRTRMRERIKVVMRHSGPRMLLRHPLLSLLHYADSLRSGALARRARPTQPLGD